MGSSCPIAGEIIGTVLKGRRSCLIKCRANLADILNTITFQKWGAVRQMPFQIVLVVIVV